MHGIGSLLLVGLLCCSLVAVSGVATASPSDMYVTVSDVAVSDDEPTTGDTITVTPTITVSSEYDGGFHINQVVLVVPGQGEVSQARHVGSIASGESVEVPLQATLNSAGEKRLRIRVRGSIEDGDGNLQRIGYVERPVYVSVSEPSTPDPATPPRVQIDAERAVAGTDGPVAVTVSNGGDEAISDLSLRLSGVHGNVDARTRVRPSLGPGNMTTFTFHVRPKEATETTLKATLRYGDDESVEAFQPIEVDPLREDVDVYASVVERNGSTLLQYRVTNRGNAPIHDVAISGTAGDTDLPGAAIGTVDAASTETVTIPVGAAPTGTVDLEASYTIDGRTGQVERTVGQTGAAATDGSADAEQSISAPAGGPDGLPLSGIGVALAGLVGVSIVGYRQRNR